MQSKVSSQSATALKSATFNLTKVADTYLDMRKWGKDWFGLTDII